MTAIRVSDPFPLKVAASPGAVQATANIVGTPSTVPGPPGPPGSPGPALPADQVAALTATFARRTEVSPEDFAGATDVAQLAAARASLASTGGVIHLTAGKTYDWGTTPLAAFDFSTNLKPITIIAWGATVTYSGTAPASVWKQSTTAALRETLTVIGGTWNAPNADSFFRCEDLSHDRFLYISGATPAGALIHHHIVSIWCERPQLIGTKDKGCREVYRFSVSDEAASTVPTPRVSFARVEIDMLDLTGTGGVAGVPKINIVDNAIKMPSLYHSKIDNVRGNIAEGVPIMKLAGDMKGTEIHPFRVEAAGGSTEAAHFLVGPGISGTNGPQFVGGPPTTSLNNMKLLHSSSVATTGLPFMPSWFPGSIKVNGGVVSGRLSSTLSSNGPVSFDVSRADRVRVLLQANCTSTTLQGVPAAPDGMPGNYTQRVTLAYQQDATGGRSYVWPTDCVFVGGSAPKDTTPDATTSVTFGFEGGTWYEISRAVAVGATSTPGARARTTDAAPVNNSTTLVTDDTIVFRVEPNSVYSLDGMVCFDASTAADLSIGWAIPSGASGYWSSGGFGPSAASSPATIALSRPLISTASGVGAVGVGTVISARVSGVLITGSSGGTFALKYAQTTADATDATVRAGTHLTLRRAN